MNPYPWTQENTYDVRRRWSARVFSVIGIPAAFIATILGGPIPAIVGFALGYRWTKTNANPRSYALIMLGSGLLLAALMSLAYGGGTTIFFGIIVPAAIIAFVWWSPTISRQAATTAYIIASQTFLITALWAITGGFSGIDRSVLSLTAPAADGPLPVSAIPRLWLIWFPYGLIAGSITLYWWTTQRDYSTQKYLRPRKPTVIARKRSERNLAQYVEHQPDDQLVPALVVSDPLPWRQDRVGVPVIVPTDDEIGHGCVLGANGSGKTIAALTLSEQMINKGITLIYGDFKGDLKNRDKLAVMADDTGSEFYSFDLRLQHDASSNCFFDPLDFAGARDEKAAIVSQSFQYETTQEAYFRAAADRWLPLQFAIMEVVGLDEGQGHFDFLAATSSVSGAKEVIAPLKDSDPGIYKALIGEIDSMDDDRLEGLRTNIRRIVATPAGARMHRPTAREIEAGGRYLDIRTLSDSGQGSVVYFGLGIGGQGSLAKMLGALVVYSIGSLVDWRNANPSAPRPDYVFMADEFGVLEEYTDMFGFLLTNARSARVWVWPMSQSLTTFTENIVNNLMTNTYWFLVFKLADTLTSEQLESKTGKIAYQVEMTEGQVQETATGGRKMKRSGGVRTSLQKDWLIPADQFTKLRPHEAFFWCNASVEPTRRDQWWRRGRVTFNEPRFGDADAAKDIPIVRFIPSELVRSEPSEEQIIDAPVVAVETDQRLSRPQEKTLHMLSRWVGDRAVTTALRTEDAAAFTELTRSSASRIINQLVSTHMQSLHENAGDDHYFTEYNKVATYTNERTLESLTDIPASYHRLPVSAVRMLHEQLGGDTTGTDEAASSAASFADDDTDLPPIDTANTGIDVPDDFVWGITEPAPDPQEPPLPDDHYPPEPPEQQQDTPADNPAPAPEPPASPAPAASFVAGQFADEDDEDQPLPFLNTAPTPIASTPETPTVAPEEPPTSPAEPSETTEPPVTETEDDTADTTALGDSGDDKDADDKTVDDGLTPDERRMRAVYERAFDLINFDPENYGLPELEVGYEYTWGDHRDGYPNGKRVKRAAWTAALEDAQRQIPALD